MIRLLIAALIALVSFACTDGGFHAGSSRRDEGSLTDDPKNPLLAVSVTSIASSAIAGQSAITQSFSVTNAGGGILAFSVSANQSWIEVTPRTGTSSGESRSISVIISASELAVGTYAGQISVWDTDQDDLKTISVSLTVLANDGTQFMRPNFTATPVQGSSCVAPCVVPLDATATTSVETARPFHDLEYLWDCGEPTAGTWPTKLGGNKNSPRGPITGCVYETAGVKNISLTLRSSSGRMSQVNRSVTVASPLEHFNPANIYCFRANSEGGFLGCPLDVDANGSCELDPGGHCVTQGSFTTALNTCGASANQRGCYFRKGDTFAGGAAFNPNSNSNSPGVIGSFGPVTGSRPLISGASGFVNLRSHWTIHGFIVQMVGDSAMFNAIGFDDHRMTIYQVEAEGEMRGCISSATGGGSTFTDLVAMVEVNCSSSGVVGSAVFLRMERSLVLGTSINNHGTGEFNLRTVHWWKSAIQHTDLLDPGNPEAGGGAGDRNPLQIRSWAQSTNAAEPSGNGPPPKETRWVEISDNHLRWHGGAGSGVGIRICQNNDCTPMDDGSGAGSPRDAVDILIERNFMSFNGASTSTNLSSGFVWAQGGRITVRNNLLDLQGITNSRGRIRLVNQTPRYTDCVGCVSDEINVQNNTIYYSENVSRPVDLCSLAQGTGHVCQLNLVWRPNDTAGGGTEVTGALATTGGNLYATVNPFIGTPPLRGQTLPEDFQLSNFSNARDQLPNPSRTSALDFGGHCRAGSPDAGIWELNLDESCPHP